MIKYSEYKKLGYSAVPKEQFAKFLNKSENTVKKYLKFNILNLDDNTKRGLCEICDIYYAEDKAGGLAGFNNDGYREQYFRSDTNKRVLEIIQLYFPRELIFRGV